MGRKQTRNFQSQRNFFGSSNLPLLRRPQIGSSHFGSTATLWGMPETSTGAKTSPISRMTGFTVLGLVALSMLVVDVRIHPIPQPQSYHSFADQRSILGVPNFWNVVSNLPFRNRWLARPQIPSKSQPGAAVLLPDSSRTTALPGPLHRTPADSTWVFLLPLAPGQRDARLGPAADDDRVHVTDLGINL